MIPRGWDHTLFGCYCGRFMAKPERVRTDAPEFKHPDDLLHRYLLLVEREVAYERGKQIVSFALGEGDGSLFYELMDDYDGKTLARGVLEGEAKAIADERANLAMDVIRRLGTDTSSTKKAWTHQDLMRLLTFYEWKMITEKGWDEPVWSSPCPWREASGFDVPPDKGNPLNGRPVTLSGT